MANDVLIHVKAKDDASKTASKIDASFKKMGAAVGISAAAAGVAVLKFGADSVKKASDLNETLNKNSVVFGKNAAEVVKWSRTSAEKLGLSQQSALAAASSFGLMFKQLGSSGTESVKLSQKVVKLAADLGSFHNLDTADVMERISAAFRGEYDSLQQLVPTISAARVEKEALAETGKKNAKSLTQEEKAMAALAIITRDSKDAMNDFAETSDGLANKQKILKARLDDIKAKIGGALMPVVQDMADAIGTMFDEWEGSGKMASDLDDLADAAESAQEAFKGFGEANESFSTFMDESTNLVQGWRVKMLRGILKVVEAWGKINPRMKLFAADLRTMLAEAQANFNATAAEINRKKIEPKLRADKRDAEKKLRDINRQLDKTHGKKARAKLEADKRAAESAIASINRQLNALNGKTATTYVRTVGGRVNAGLRASGGYVGGEHAAEGGPRSGGVLVGESGPEWVDLPMGSHVNSNPDTQRMMMGSGRGGNITINVNAPNYVGAPSDLLRALVDAKRRGQLDVILR